LVNGEPFYAFGGVICYYQLIDGEYYFAVGFARGTGFPEFVSIESNQKEIQMGINQLTESGEGKIYGKVIFNSNDEFLNRTDEQNNGFLEITNFDTNNNIISGVFEFSIVNQENGIIYNITDGRFDSFYAQ